MTITRANVESLLIRRVGALFTELSLDGTTVSGANPDLNDPIGYAVRQCGGTVTSPTAVADADLAGIAEEDTDKLLDFAELRALKTALTVARRLVTHQEGPRREDLSDLAEGLAADITFRQAEIGESYGLGVGALEAGVLTLEMMESNEVEEDA